MDRDILEMTRNRIYWNEGFEPNEYLCPSKFPTIGIGFRTSTLAMYGLKKVENLNQMLAFHILDFFIEKIYNELNEKYNWLGQMPDEAISVMIEMIFQMGWGNSKKGFLSFKNTIKYLKQGKYTKASDEMLDSEWARPEKGTPQRAKRLSEMIRKLADEQE